jgi:hypothetical protein
VTTEETRVRAFAGAAAAHFHAIYCKRRMGETYANESACRCVSTATHARRSAINAGQGGGATLALPLPLHCLGEFYVDTFDDLSILSLSFSAALPVSFFCALSPFLPHEFLRLTGVTGGDGGDGGGGGGVSDQELPNEGDNRRSRAQYLVRMPHPLSVAHALLPSPSRPSFSFTSDSEWPFRWSYGSQQKRV